MAKKRRLSPEHKKKLSESMKKHHASMQSANTIHKGVADGQFGAQAAEYGMSVQAYRAMSKSMGPDQAYQLSIDVRSAVQAIATNIGKMKIRLYNGRSGKEIVGGDLWEFFHRPAPRFTSSRWLSEIASYYALQNEVALLRDPGTSAPKFLMPLNPTKLFISTPTVVRDISQVQEWRYSWEDGLIAQYKNDQICFDKMFNPISNVRGLSPILTGQNEIGSSYEAGRYNKTYFENGAVPSHMLVLPEGTPRQQRQDIEQRYLATFGLGEGNAHKVMVVSGGDVKVESLDNRPKDAEFVNLISMNTQKIAQLFKVPAVEMGIYDKTRFETAPTEREMFYENTLVPLAERIADFLQDQVVDRWFSNTSVKTVDTNFTKSKREMFEKAHARSLSSVVVVIDHEASPIAAKVMKDRVQATAELRRSAGLSFNEAASYVGLELPEPKQNPDNFRDMVYIPTGEQRIDNILTPIVPVVEEPIAPEPVAEEPTAEVDKALTKKINSTLKKYRKQVLEAADSQQMYSLKSIDDLFIKEELLNETIKNSIRKDYLQLKSLVKDGNIDGIKDYLNKKDRKWIKTIAIKIQKEECK